MRRRERRLRVRDEREVAVRERVVGRAVRVVGRAVPVGFARRVRLRGFALGVASTIFQRREPRERRLRRLRRDHAAGWFVERGDETARRASPRRERLRRRSRAAESRRREEKPNERRRAARRRRRARFRTRARRHDGDDRARDASNRDERFGFDPGPGPRTGVELVGPGSLVFVAEDAFGRERREGVYGRGGGV